MTSAVSPLFNQPRLRHLSQVHRGVPGPSAARAHAAHAAGPGSAGRGGAGHGGAAADGSRAVVKLGGSFHGHGIGSNHRQ